MIDPYPKTDTQEVRELAEQLRPGASQGILRQGVIDAYTAGANVCSVRWGGGAAVTPSQRFLRSYLPRVNDVVWGVTDEDDMLILGPVNLPTLVTPSSGWTTGWTQTASYPWSFWRDAAGMVHMEGEMTAAANSDTFYTLPAGYRPVRRVSFAVVANGGAAWVGINPTGVMDVHGAVSGSWFSFGNIHYRTA